MGSDAIGRQWNGVRDMKKIPLLMHPIVPDYSSDTVQDLLYFVNGDGIQTGQMELPKSSDYQHCLKREVGECK